MIDINKAKTEVWKIKDIRPAPYNPRNFSHDEEMKLLQSLEQFGYVNNLVVNRKTKHVVGGNQRLKALIKHGGFKELEVKVVDLPLAEEKLLNIALNKIGGVFDLPKLTDIFNEIEKDHPTMNLTLSGFFMPEIEKLTTNMDVKIINEPSDFEKEADAKLKNGDININVTQKEVKEDIPTFKAFSEESVETNVTCPKCHYEFTVDED